MYSKLSIIRVTTNILKKVHNFYSLIELVVQKVGIMVRCAEFRLPQDCAEKCLVAYHNMMCIFQVLLYKSTFLRQIFGKFSATYKPLAAHKLINTVDFSYKGRKSIDTMNGIVTFNKVVPKTHIWLCRSQSLRLLARYKKDENKLISVHK